MEPDHRDRHAGRQLGSLLAQRDSGIHSRLSCGDGCRSDFGAGELHVAIGASAAPLGYATADGAPRLAHTTVLDFTSALYLGMKHPSGSLRSWSHFTRGVPAALFGLPA